MKVSTIVGLSLAGSSLCLSVAALTVAIIALSKKRG